MKYVIDIPEGMLDELRTCKFPIQEAYRLCLVIENGKPLPKGHGRLIDADKLIKDNGLAKATKYGNKTKEQLQFSYDTMMMYEIFDLIDDSEVVVEADKEGAEE